MERLILGSDIVLASTDVDPNWLHPPTGNPANVVCDITAFGATGSLAGTPHSEIEIQALSGIMDTTGYADGPPVPIRVPIVDVVAGTYAAAAVLAAHRLRRVQGAGQKVDIALFDGAFAALRSFLTNVLTTKTGNKSRMGNRHPTVAPWNLYRTSDGFVLICAGNTFGMYERLCKLIGRPDLAPMFPTQKSRIGAVAVMDPAIEAWTSQRSTAECVEQTLAVGVVSGPIAPVDDYTREPNLDFRKMVRRLDDPVSGRDLFVPASPLRMSVTSGISPASIPSPDGDRAEITRLAAGMRPAQAKLARGHALDGIRIIEIGQYTTAPMCSRELAHLGAEVIRIEQPSGSESRAGADQINGVSVSFRMNNADKRTMVVDLTDAFDVDVLKRMIAEADVLVENLKPGTLTKFGFTPAAIQARNPRLVYCAITGFGVDSLYPTRPAFDMVITAMGGFMSVLAADGMPLKSGISTADLMGAEMAMVAILGALDYLERTGEGQFVDLSMQDVTAWLTQASWNSAFDGRVEPAVMKAADGYVVVEAGEARLEGIPGREVWASLDRGALVDRLARAGVKAVPVQTVREAAGMPHTMERRLWFTMTEDGAEWPMLGSPLRLTATPPRVRHLAVPMNTDRAALLAELGLTPPEPEPANG